MVELPTREALLSTNAPPWQGKVALVAKPGGTNTGVGRYVAMLQQGLQALGIDAVRVAPTVPPMPNAGYALLHRMGMDVRTFLLNFPIWSSYPKADVYHFTSQNLASLLLVRRPAGTVIVTVHDIIPYVLRNHPQLCSYRTLADRLFDQMAMWGLKRADYVLADSHFTKQCIVEQLGIAAEKIQVIYLGIDHERFRPQPVPERVREHYQLPSDNRYLLFVGSEDPRKNLETLVRALPEIRGMLPDVVVLKVGQAHYDRERQRLQYLTRQLGVSDAVRFLDDVPEDDLPLLYNLADVFVMPSLYEGFGFPVLEAQACGTPVISTRATSLPEVNGDASLFFDHWGDMPSNLAAAVIRLLTDQDLYQTLRIRGHANAATFVWERTTQETVDVYRSRCGQRV